MKTFKPKNIHLKDGTEISLRAPTEADLNNLSDLFLSFPKEEQRFFRADVTQKRNIEKHLELMKTGLVQRIVAIHDKIIVAEGSLELNPIEWEKHVGEIRLIIAKEYRNKGLGRMLSRELYFLSVAAKLEKIEAKIIREQTVAKKLLHKLGFHDEVILPDHVKDRDGQSRDLIVMSVDLNALWEELEDHLHLTDVSRQIHEK